MTQLDHRAPLAPAIVVRFEESVDEELRRAANDLEVSLAELVRTIVDWWRRELNSTF